jgi:hypothetical protein
MNLDAFWTAVDDVLDRIASEKPNTFDGVKAILDTHEAKAGPDEAFFAGSGGDRTLYGSLHAAGWETTWFEAGYYYGARHPATGDELSYVEGDVLRGNQGPSPDPDL